jgi:pseudouridylate synthase
MRVSAGVREALAEGGPVVALESTVIAQGLPRPRNLEVAIDLERRVRAGGAEPATVALLEGVPTVGLTVTELERIATEDGVVKLSTRDLSLAASRRTTGATTVAATAFLAARAGIEVFATGGIGGVHRDLPPDVSADLFELHRTRMLVVCAGAKSILDLPATRELLESLGVLVLGWRTDTFPAFYSGQTYLPVDARVESADDVATVWTTHHGMQAPGSVLLCAPIPEERALPRAEVDRAIEIALRGAATAGVTGAGVTPYLLAEIDRAMGGAALDANVALLRNNAEIAASVAVRLSR